MNSFRSLIVFSGLAAIFLFSCSNSPLEPTTNTIYVNGTNWIYYGAGTAVGGQVAIDPAISAKGCKLKIFLGDTAYSVVPANSPTINWIWGTLASNVYYSFRFELENASGQSVWSVWTNIAAPSAGCVIDLTAVQEIYDLTGTKRQIPGTGTSVYGMDCNSSYVYTAEGLEDSTLNLRRYSSSALSLVTLVSDIPISGYRAEIQVVNSRIFLAYMDGSYLSAVSVYSNDGSLITSWNPPISYLDRMAVNSAGDVYLNDTSDGTIYIFDANGNSLGSFGGIGTGPGTFISELNNTMAIGPGDVLYVWDSEFPRLQTFSSGGGYLSTISFPFEVWTLYEIDNSGNIYFSNMKLSPSGGLITALDSGYDSGAFDTVDPSGLYAYYYNYTDRSIYKTQLQ